MQSQFFITANLFGEWYKDIKSRLIMKRQKWVESCSQVLFLGSWVNKSKQLCGWWIGFKSLETRSVNEHRGKIRQMPNWALQSGQSHHSFSGEITTYRRVFTTIEAEGNFFKPAKPHQKIIKENKNPENCFFSTYSASIKPHQCKHQKPKPNVNYKQTQPCWLDKKPTSRESDKEWQNFIIYKL